jgi:small conductance mechanosensitive channel
MNIDFRALGEEATRRLTGWLLDHGTTVLLIVVGALVVIRVSRAVGNRIVAAASDQDETTTTEREKRAATLSQIINTVTRIGVWVIAGLMIGREFGMDIGPILAGAGVAGLAVGFGAQSLVKDFLAGFFLLIEDQVRVGDVVKAAGQAGQVERMTLRTIVLRDITGTLHVIPNGHIDTVSNLTYQWSRAVLDIGVSYNEDLDHVFAVMRRVGEELRVDPEYAPLILEELEILGLDSFGDSALIIKAYFKTTPLKQWNVAREYRRRLKKAFDAEGIEIPYPHHTVYHRVEEPLALLAGDGTVRGARGKYGWSPAKQPPETSRDSAGGRGAG